MLVLFKSCSNQFKETFCQIQNEDEKQRQLQW